MFDSMRRVALAAAAFSLFALTAAHASDPADVAYWQSVQSSKNPKEYQAYLHAFPHGAFAELAQERIRELSGGQNQPAPAAAPAGQGGLGPVVGKGTIAVVPPSPQVGDAIHLTLDRFPHMTTTDIIIIVPTGSPDTITQPGAPGMLGWTYASSCIGATNPYACRFGPLAPGTYEVRWLTQLYNNQQKYQVGARAQFTVAD